jgi:hypothetical protein
MRKRRKRAIIFDNRVYDSVEQAALLTGKSISQVQYKVYRKYKRKRVGDAAKENQAYDHAERATHSA